MSDRLCIVIAEDNYLVREGTRRLLEDSGEPGPTAPNPASVSPLVHGSMPSPVIPLKKRNACRSQREWFPVVGRRPCSTEPC